MSNNWMTEDYLSPAKRAIKNHRHEVAKNKGVEEKSYGWWESRFAKLDNEIKQAEAATRKVTKNKGKVTIETRKEEKENVRK